jgi:hypothetical protein
VIWNFCNLCLGWVDLYVIIPVHGIGSIKTTRGQITCYCPRKMLLPRRQITRRKLCFYYTCKFGVISIKYVIRCSKHWSIILRSWRQFNLNVNKKFESEVVSFSVHCLMTYVYNSSHNCVGNNIVVLLVLVRICHIMTQRWFMLCTTYTNFWFIVCPLEVRCLTQLSKIFQLLLLWRKL